MTLYGKATIRTDKPILEKLYGSTDDMWFDGIDDPNLTAICVEPLDAHYWDTKHYKLTTMLKMGTALVQGDQPDVGISGDLKA